MRPGRPRTENASRHSTLPNRRSGACPPLPALPAVPGAARWNAALQKASHLLSMVCSEMADYADARSERWQQSERGEAFAARLDELTPLSEQLETLL